MKIFRSRMLNLVGILLLVTTAATMGPTSRVAEASLEAITYQPTSSAPRVFGPGLENVSAFHFLDPIAPSSGDPSKFDPAYLDYLLVEVCRVDSSGCTFIKSFTAQTPGSEKLRIATDRHGSIYIANWETSKSNFNNRATYRVTVSAAGIELGSVDLTPDIYSTFGRTWPIKFMIEKDPALRVRLFRSLGKSCSQAASMLRLDFGLEEEEVVFLLGNDENPCSPNEIEVAIDGVFQDVVVPPTTKITDESTRNVLGSYDPDSGKMVFALETPLLKNVKVGDVFVSEPGPGAPYGYLRRITAVQRSKGIVTLGSVQANLTEAIYKGHLNASGELKPSASAAGSAFSAGRARTAELRPSLESDTGDTFTFQKDIDVTVNLEGGDDELGGTGTVNVKGSVYFNAGYNLGLGIESCLEVPPVCVDRVEAWAGVEQKSRLKVTGQFVGKLHKEQVIDKLPIDPIVFFIGPVPVVLVPSVNIVLGVDGEARINFSFEAEAKTKIKVGAKWTDPDDGGIGWENISEYNPLDKLFIDADIDGSIRMDAFGKLDAKLLLYGVIGPGMDGSLGIGGIAQTNTKPLWKIYGHVNMNVNVSADAIGFFGIGELWSQEVFNTYFDIQEAPNLKPVCSWVTDTIPAEIGQLKVLGPRSGLVGHFECSDPEGDTLTYSAVSSNTSDGTNGVIPLSYAFQSSGFRTVTVTAHDSDGGQFSFPLKIDVHNSLPIVNISAGTTVPAAVQFFASAEAFDPDTNTFLACNRLSWHVSSPDTVTVLNDGGTCNAVVRFNQEGTRSLTVNATDQYGGIGTKSISVNVTTAPANRPPEIDPFSFSIRAWTSPTTQGCIGLGGTMCTAPDGSFLWSGIGPRGFDEYETPLFMKVVATDPDGTTPTYSWRCETGTQLANITDEGNDRFSCTPIYATNNGIPIPIKVYAVVSDGVNSVETVRYTYHYRARTN
jgi:hypothetical protein